MNQATTVWTKVCDTIKTRIGETAFEAWLKPIKPALDDCEKELQLQVPNEFFKDWVIQHYDLIIKDLLKHIDVDLKISYLVNKEMGAQISKQKKKIFEKAVSADTPKGGQFLNPRYTFENFIVGPSNRFTHAACVAIAASPAKAYNPLFIYGKVGLGKTHLMQAICHRIKQKNPSARFYFTPSEKFTNELINAIQNRSTQKFREKFRNVDVLLIDDIHFIANKEATQEEFFHTFNALYDNHKQIIISSDRPPKEIQKLEERLVSRFGWGLVADIQFPDLETRIAILKKKIENEAIKISDNIIYFIADAIKTNIRELEGALVRVIAYALLQEEELTLEMTKTVLKDLLHENSKQITAEEIQRTVAKHFGINPLDLKTKKRVKNIVLPRQVAMYIIRELTNLSLPEIGQFFGGKDHTTVLYAHKKIKQDLQINSELKVVVEKLFTEIKG
ncbi:MAG: chromosomal replication initiator protein DnaA [Candidatus Omnitrophota bacterium]